MVSLNDLFEHVSKFFGQPVDTTLPAEPIPTGMAGVNVDTTKKELRSGKISWYITVRVIDPANRRGVKIRVATTNLSNLTDQWLERHLKEAFEVRAKLERDAVTSGAVAKEDLGRSHDYSQRSEDGEVITTRNDVIRAIQSKCRRKRLPFPPEAKG